MAFPILFENDRLLERFQAFDKGTVVDFTIPGFIPPPATVCMHGMSLDLCDGPNHYPQDTGWDGDDWWGGVDG